jgi:hypothetical protein
MRQAQSRKLDFSPTVEGNLTKGRLETRQMVETEMEEQAKLQWHSKPL